MKSGLLLAVGAATAAAVDCNVPDGQGGHLVYAGSLSTECCGALMNHVAAGAINLNLGTMVSSCLPQTWNLTSGACAVNQTDNATLFGNRSFTDSDYGFYPTDASFYAGLSEECKDNRLCGATILSALSTHTSSGTMNAGLILSLGATYASYCPGLSAVVGALSCEPIPTVLNFGPSTTQCCEAYSVFAAYGAMATPAGPMVINSCYAHDYGCEIDGKLPSATAVGVALGSVCGGSCSSTQAGLLENAGSLNAILGAGMDANADNVTDICVRMCVRPNFTAEYDTTSLVEVSLSALGIMGGSVIGITCASGYTGTPVVAACAATGLTYSVSGCTAPTTTTAEPLTTTAATVTTTDAGNSTVTPTTTTTTTTTTGASHALTQPLTLSHVCSHWSTSWDGADRATNVALSECQNSTGVEVDISGMVNVGVGFNTTSNTALCTNAATGNVVVEKTCADVIALMNSQSAADFPNFIPALENDVPYTCCQGTVPPAAPSSAASMGVALITFFTAMLYVFA